MNIQFSTPKKVDRQCQKNGENQITLGTVLFGKPTTSKIKI